MLRNVGLDEYSRNARLKPAMLTVLPAALTVASWPSGSGLGWSSVWGLFVASGGTLLLSQLARDRGKRLEQSLFETHGGRPTERLLSHATAPNKVVLAQRHAKLGKLLAGVAFPSAADESGNPKAANDIYVAGVTHLISLTRSDRLLLQENMNYGFRCNLLGLKPFGIAIAGVTAAIACVQLLQHLVDRTFPAPATVASGILDIALLAMWLLLVTPRWVMTGASAYAERLLEALDRLPSQ